MAVQPAAGYSLETVPKKSSYPLKIKEGQDVESFLTKYPPSQGRDSILTEDGDRIMTDWIWCRRAKSEDHESMTEERQSELMQRAMEIEQELAAECERIAQDDSIPTRISKAKPRNKKICREEQHEKTHAALKKLAQDLNVTSGKFLFYATDEVVDANWGKIVRAMLNEDGHLRDTTIDTAKISTTPAEEGGTRVICVYVRDSYDKTQVATAFQALVKKLYMVPNSFKADVYTIAGLYSKHPSQIKSTLYSNDDFMTKAEIKEFFENQKAKPVKEDEAKEAKRVEANGGFEDDSEEDEPPKKKAKKT